MFFLAEIRVVRILKLSSRTIFLLLVIVGGAFAFLPSPPDVDPRAFPLFGVFFALILGLLFRPYPNVTLTLTAFCVCLLFRLISPSDGFSGFGKGVIWLVVFASLAAKAFVKTPLGHRTACLFIKAMGRSSLSLAYGVTLSELVMATAIPSNTARATCISLPLTVSTCKSLKSDPQHKTEGLIGQFLCLCSLHANQLTCPIFLTAMACNPLMVKFMGKLNVSVSWGEWFAMCALPGLICLLAMPLILYRLAPPKLKELPQAKAIAQEQLDAMPLMDQKEWIALFVFVGMLTFWILGDRLHLKPAVVALGGLCCLLITNVLTVEDVTGAKDVWNIMIWLAILNILAGKLTEYGFIRHYTAVLQAHMGVVRWPWALAIGSVIYNLARYLLPGNILHGCAMFIAFSQLLIACGVPPKVGCMTLAIITSYCGFMTPYANSTGPLYQNTGYIEQGLWWRTGFITSFFYLVIWAIVGGLWWKVLGYY